MDFCMMFIWCQWVGSNHRPRGYESRALTSWATLASTKENMMVAEVWIEHYDPPRRIMSLASSYLFDSLEWLRRYESNIRPQGYEPCELPLLYSAIYGILSIAEWLYRILESVNVFFQRVDQIFCTDTGKLSTHQGNRQILIGDFPYFLSVQDLVDLAIGVTCSDEWEICIALFSRESTESSIHIPEKWNWSLYHMSKCGISTDDGEFACIYELIEFVSGEEGESWELRTENWELRRWVKNIHRQITWETLPVDASEGIWVCEYRDVFLLVPPPVGFEFATLRRWVRAKQEVVTRSIGRVPPLTPPMRGRNWY